MHENGVYWPVRKNLTGGFDESSNSDNNQDKKLKPPEKLTDFERRQIVFAWTELDTGLRDAYILNRGFDWSENKTGDFLGISGLDVVECVRTVRSILTEGLTRLIIAWLREEEKQPGAAHLTESEAETARIAFRFLPEKQRNIWKISLLTGESDEEIAATLGLTPEKVISEIDFAKSSLGLRAEILAISWLRETENGEPRMFRLFREIRKRAATIPKNKADFVFLKAEILEIEKAIRSIDFDAREAFVLCFGAERDPPEIADIQRTDVETTVGRLRKGAGIVCRHVERLLVAGLLKRVKHLKTARLKQTESLTAKQVYRAIPRKCREIFVRFHVKGASKREIAEEMEISIDKVESRLERAKKTIRDRTLRLASLTMRQRRDGRPVGEILLGDPKRIRFAATVWNEPKPIETSNVSEPQASARGKSPKHSLTLHALKNHAKNILSGIGLFTQMGAAQPGNAAAGLAVPTLAALAAPFLWVMSLLVCGRIYGSKFVRTAPTLHARRWLVKQLFYGYSLILVAPFALLFMLSNLGCVNPKFQQLIFLGFFSTVFCAIFMYVFRVSYSYNTFCIVDKSPESHQRIGKNTERIVHAGLIVDTILILAALWEYAKDSVLSMPHEKLDLSVWRFVFLAGVVGAVHASFYFMFRDLLGISKDEKLFNAYPPVGVPSFVIPTKIKFAELFYILPFTLPPIAGNSFHLLLIREHPVGSTLELVLYITWWLLIWCWNTQTTTARFWKWVRILLTFGGQAAIMAALRHFVY